MLYEGLLAVLMRLVFLLYAEDRGLVPSRDDALARAFYAQGYGVRSLHGRLLEDEALHPDTMDERRGAWHRLLALFRLVHAGDSLAAGTSWMRGRGGKLFDPRSFPFLEGAATTAGPAMVPLVSDGCVLRVLDGLLTLDGERLSYRALDVEQIGSVYETVMGFRAFVAAGPSLAIRAGKRDRTPVLVDLAALAAIPGKDRLRWLKENTERGKFPARAERAIAAARDADTLAAALAEVVDERGSPSSRVWPKGTPLLQPTDERRRTGSHYTPRDLTAPVVRYALEPAFERIGPLALPDEVLSLKVCDPAMGSGAFLVEACRQLAARLIEAWRVHPHLRPVLPPDEDEELHARRLVAQRCLYGVDRNRMATDLARLSLWLATLARDHEFTFLDHALRTGDSLVGLSRAQIERLDWRDDAQRSLFGGIVGGRLAAALEARTEIRAAGDDVTLYEQEQRQAVAEVNMAELRLVGDAVVAAYFGNAKDKARRAALERLHEAASSTDRMWPALQAAAAGLQAGALPVRPFHWELEFPEVFAGEAPGFDVIVGNPPFAGKNTLLNGNRDGYLDWLQAIHSGAHGNADLVAHFVRRAFGLLRFGGCFGLIATNTVGQGDTRESGLRTVIESGGSVLRATKRLVWPGEAAVIVSVLHVGKGVTVQDAILDEVPVKRISAYLFEGSLDASPSPLLENSQIAFEGCKIYGQGFLFDDAEAEKGQASNLSEMQRLMETNAWNRSRILPYVGGDEISNNIEPLHSRFVIDFNDFPLSRTTNLGSWYQLSGSERAKLLRSSHVPFDYPGPVAHDWPDLINIITRLVRPYRSKQTRPALRERWWQFGEKRPGLRRATSSLQAVLVLTRISPHLNFRIVQNQYIFQHMAVVFATASYGFFGLMQSRVHEIWARYFSSTMEDRIDYSLTDAFRTTPFRVFQ